MKLRIKVVLAVFFLFFGLFLFIEQPELSTGMAVTDRVTSFFVGNSISSLGPLTIISLIFSVAIIGIYEIRKK